MYVGGYTDRYAVCTCNSLNGCEFADCTEALLETPGADMLRETTAAETMLPEVHRDWDLEELIGKMSVAKNGAFHKDVMPKERPPFVFIDEKGREKVNAPLLAEYVKEHIDYCLIRENERSNTLPYVYTNGVYKFHTEKMFNGIIKQFIYDYKLPLASMRVINEARNLLLAEAETMDHKVFNNSFLFKLKSSHSRNVLSSHPISS